MSFYTYLWLREDGTPYYVGKGTGNRAFKRGQRKAVFPPRDVSRILIQEFVSEPEAFEAEKFLISYYGRKDLGLGDLRNLTDGGDGASGFKHSEKRCQELSRYWKGRVFRPETLRKMSEAKRQEFCKRGHPLIGDNVYVRLDRGSRSCKTCNKERNKINAHNKRKDAVSISLTRIQF